MLCMKIGILVIFDRNKFPWKLDFKSIFLLNWKSGD